MVRQLRGVGVRGDRARDLPRASSPLLVAPLGGVGPSESDGTGPPPKGVVCGGAGSGRGTCWRGRGGYRGRSSGRGLAASALLHALIHRSAWKRNSRNSIYRTLHNSPLPDWGGILPCRYQTYYATCCGAT